MMIMSAIFILMSFKLTYIISLPYIGNDFSFPSGEILGCLQCYDNSNTCIHDSDFDNVGIFCIGEAYPYLRNP